MLLKSHCDGDGGNVLFAGATVGYVLGDGGNVLFAGTTVGYVHGDGADVHGVDCLVEELMMSIVMVLVLIV